MVFQDYTLFPHLTVLNNITLAPVRAGKLRRDEAEEMAHRLLKRVGLDGYARSYPTALSGGQQQRVAIVREIERASSRGRVCQYVSISGVAVSLKKKN